MYGCGRLGLVLDARGNHASQSLLHPGLARFQGERQPPRTRMLASPHAHAYAGQPPCTRICWPAPTHTRASQSLPTGLQEPAILAALRAPVSFLACLLMSCLVHVVLGVTCRCNVCCSDGKGVQNLYQLWTRPST